MGQEIQSTQKSGSIHPHAECLLHVAYFYQEKSSQEVHRMLASYSLQEGINWLSSGGAQHLLQQCLEESLAKEKKKKNSDNSDTLGDSW